MIIKNKTWKKYISTLSGLEKKAAEEMVTFINRRNLDITIDNKELIDMAYILATKYGEGAAAAACEMYDALAIMQGASVPAAVPAATATYHETAAAINGSILTSLREDMLGSSVGRLVKMAGVDTTMQNAIRDGAEWAWIPSGDTCAFCITLASNGWQKASKAALNGGHAEHIHNNCDCTYAIRFDGESSVAGYDPDEYYLQYKNAAPGQNSKAKINAMRREQYSKNKEAINEQKREAYAERKELENK